MKKIIITERQQKLLSTLANKKTYKITKEQHARVQLLLKEDVGSPDLHQAVAQLIHDIYNTPSQAGLGDFWVRNDITWADINTYLTSLGLIIATGSGTYELARRVKNRLFRKPAEAAAAVEQSLEVLVKKKGNYLKSEHPELEMEDANLTNEIAEVAESYKAIAMNKEIAILKNATGESFVFYYDEIPEENFSDINDISNYVNNNIDSIKIGAGIEGFQGDSQLIKIDNELKGNLIDLYDKSPSIIQAISQLSEMTSAGSSATGGSSGPFVAPMHAPIIKKTPVVSEGLLREFNIMQSHVLNQKYNKDYDGRFNVNEGPVAGSSADGGSSGPYDANALPGIGRNGEFKKTKKSKAEVSTQYPSGTFVDKDGTQKKGKGSVISKSALLETIINELGLGDWKVSAILKKLGEVENNLEVYPQLFKMITGVELRASKFPKETLVLALREMDKPDIDYVYDNMFPNDI